MIICNILIYLMIEFIYAMEPKINHHFDKIYIILLVLPNYIYLIKIFLKIIPRLLILTIRIFFHPSPVSCINMLILSINKK